MTGVQTCALPIYTTQPVRYSADYGILAFLEPVSAASKKYSLTKGAYIDKKIYITDAMVAEFEQLVCGTWKKINKLDFAKLPERDFKKCKNCTFDSICWDS